MMRQTHHLFLILVALCFVLLLSSTTVYATPQAADTMRVANRLYERGNYTESSRLYQTLVEQGYSDVALFHNLGNAYMQQNQIGRAVANYKRALSIDPSHSGSSKNLQQAEARIVESFPSTNNDNSVAKLLSGITTYVTRSQSGYLAIGMWLLWGVAYLVYRRGWPTDIMRRLLLMITVGVIISAAIFFTIGWLDQQRPDAVIIQSAVAVYPQAASTQNTDQPLFTLHDGAMVHIRRQSAEWVHIQLEHSDISGWITADSIEKIVVD